LKKNKPRRWAANPMAMYAALNRVTLVKDAGSDNIHMRIVAHDALDVLRQGKATRGHMQMIVEAANMAETLAIQHNIGRDWLPEISVAQECIRSLAARGAKIGRYVLTGTELNALNLLMQIHDSQLDACTIHTLGLAVDYIRMRIDAKQVTMLPAIKEAA
jgi:hypothetical protein